MLETTPSVPCVGAHSRSSLRPVSTFSATELEDAIRCMKSTLESPIPGLPDEALPDSPSVVPEAMRHIEGSDTQEMKKYRCGELTEEHFLQLWNMREPFVLTDVTDPATPETLLDLKTHGRKVCTTAFYEKGTLNTKRSTLGAYFKTWDRVRKPLPPLQIRVSFLTLCPMYSHSR
jgi:hypothetical protein